MLLVHGVSEHSGRYAHVGERLAATGYAAYAHDHRGHGRSGGDRVVIDRFENAIADLDAFVSIVGDRHPDLPLYVLGHSMGGGISIGYALQHEDRIDGLILSAPLSNADAANPVQRLAATTLSRFAPKLGIFPVDSATVSRDPEVVKAYDDDPLVDRRKLPARTVAELTENVADFADRVPQLGLPVLLMHGSTDKTFERYDGLFHEILNEPEQDAVIDDVIRWLDSHVAAA